MRDRTAMTLQAVRNSFKSCDLRDALKVDADEVFYFRDRQDMNGAGELLEIWDYAFDWSSVSTAAGDIPTTPETTVYYR